MASALKGNRINVGTVTSDPAGADGDMVFNTGNKTLKVYSSGGWANVWSARDGLTAATAVFSGEDLMENSSSATTGTYYVNPNEVGSVIQMYIDTTYDGGGYDFYWCTGCTASSYVTDSNSCPSGTSWVYGRSRDHWRIMITQWGNNSSPNAGSVYKTGGGGNYTGCIMRNPAHHASGCSDWRVPDGGKWWLRDSTHNEPNGDYNGNGWLQTYSSQTAGSDIGMNDGGAYSTGSNYLCSTNVKTGE